MFATQVIAFDCFFEGFDAGKKIFWMDAMHLLGDFLGWNPHPGVKKLSGLNPKRST